jgi:putative methionine-R-sulfoxide reductase with GAF domain
LKTYRSPRELLAEIECLLAANQPSFHHSPLQDVVELLCRGRHYTWMGIYLAVGKNAPHQLLDSGRDPHPGRMEMPETRTKILVSMKLGGREVGVLDVESDRENAFGVEDRVLLENVAAKLARFLTGTGKYLARKARGQSLAQAGRSVAAGEK